MSMAQEGQIELSLDMGAGDFSVTVAGVTMKLRLKGGNGAIPEDLRSSSAAWPPLAFPQGNPDLKSTPPRWEEEAEFYRQTSEEIYAGLGKLAKEINLSLQDLCVAEMMREGGPSPGEHLDQARVQLHDVLAMTERATLDILDLVERIRDECAILEGLLRPSRQEDAGSPREQGPTDGPWAELAGLLTETHELGTRILALNPEDQAAGGAGRRFSLAEALQMLLECCGAEAVKPHLKSLLAQHAALFPLEATEVELSRLAAQAPVAEGFHQVPVEQILELLQGCCQDERGRDFLAKLIASAAKVFPVAVLPLEGQVSAPPAEAAPGLQELRERWLALLPRLEAACKHLPPDCGTLDDSRENGVSDPAAALAATRRIQANLSRITEALAFQDLSGQRLLKVLKILRQVQVQVLTLLVATGNRLKMKAEGREVPLKECEIQAQEELLRLLGAPPAAGPGQPPVESSKSPEGEPLDQAAINDLLTDLGF